MCGLVAVVRLREDAPPIDRARLGVATRRLAHRGPDAETTWVAPDGRVAFGHRRLAIVDRAGGHQPFHSEDGAITAVINGELYGFEAQRAELAARGHRLRTRADGEVVVHLWEEEGPALLDRLEGEFALVLWDARAGTLMAARDRFGVKPLCWATHDGVLWLASEAKALLAAGLPAAWDEVALHRALAAQYAPPDRTLFAGIRQLPAGHRLRVEDGRVHVERWWDLELPRRGAHPAVDRPELAVREALEAAVARRLRAEVPVAVQLSGGVDSAAVLGLAARHATAPLTAFTLGFEGAAFDETAAAAAMAARAGVAHHAVPVSAEALATVWTDAVEASEGLAINGHLPAKYLLHRAVRAAGCGVVLTGEGADEVLLGYPHFRRDVAREAGEDRAAALWATNARSRGIMLPDGPGLSTAAVAARLGAVPTFLEAKAGLGLRLSVLCAPDGPRAGVDAYAELLEEQPVEAQLAGRSAVEQAQYLWAKLALPVYLLRTLGDGTEMPHAVEGRLPFLDHALFCRLRALPVEARIRDGVEKWALRAAVRDVVTPEIVAREKQPLMAPPLTVTPRWRELLGDAVASAALARNPLLDIARVRRWFAGLDALDAAARAREEPVALTVLSVAALAERYRL